MTSRLIICGLGYTGTTIDSAWRAVSGRSTLATVRTYEAASRLEEAGRSMVRADFSEGPLPALVGISARAGVITFGTSGQSAPEETVTQAVTWLAHAGCKSVVYLSSTSVYGDCNGAVVDETAPVRPTTQMGEKRVAAELAFRAEAERRGLTPSVMRLPGIYGPDRTPRARFVSGAYRFPEGERWSNRVYRADVASAVVHVIEGGHSGTFNVSDGEPFLANEFATWCAGELGIPTPVAVPFAEISERARPFWCANRRVDNRRLRATGWSPTVANYKDGHRLAWQTEDLRWSPED